MRLRHCVGSAAAIVMIASLATGAEPAPTPTTLAPTSTAPALPVLEQCGNFSPNSGPTSKTSTTVIGSNIAGATFYADGVKMTSQPAIGPGKDPLREIVVSVPLDSSVSPFGYIGLVRDGQSARCPSPYRGQDVTVTADVSSTAPGSTVKLGVGGINTCVGSTVNVFFGGASAGMATMGIGCTFTVKVPQSAQSGPIVVLTAGYGQGTSAPITITGANPARDANGATPPIITSIDSMPARPGAEVKLRGYNLDRITQLSAGTVRNVSPTEAVLVVSPSVRSGPIKVSWARSTYLGPVFLRTPVP